MTKEKAITELPMYAEAELPKQNVIPKYKMFDSHIFLRRYGIVLIAFAAFTRGFKRLELRE